MALRRINARLYTAGVYGPFSLTGIARANANAVRLTITQPSIWPNVPQALRVTYGFTLNGAPSYAGEAVFPGGWLTARDGTTGTGVLTLSSDTIPEFDSAYLEFEAFVDLSAGFVVESLVRDLHMLAAKK